MSESSGLAAKITSILMAAIAAALFGLSIYYVFFGATPRGEWRPGFQDNAVVTPNLQDRNGRSVTLEHPALIGLVSTSCRYCPPAIESMTSFLADADRPADGPNVAAYLIYKGELPDRPGAGGSHLTAVLTPSGPNPALGFVQKIPTFLRTDDDGRVLRAYVGIPDTVVGRNLRWPGTTGPRARGGGCPDRRGGRRGARAGPGKAS